MNTGLIDWLTCGQQTSSPDVVTFSDTRKGDGKGSQRPGWRWFRPCPISKLVASSVFDIDII